MRTVPSHQWDISHGSPIPMDKPVDITIIVNYCCTRVLRYAMMLKETETEETIRFLSHFYHWWHLNWGGGGGPSMPPWLRLCVACQASFTQAVAVARLNFSKVRDRKSSFSHTATYRENLSFSRLCTKDPVQVYDYSVGSHFKYLITNLL